MRSLKAVLSLALVSLAAAAFALPAVASAEEWLQGGEPLLENASVGLDGPIYWTLPGVISVGCDFEGEAALFSGGGQGELSSLNADIESCEAKGAWLANCYVSSVDTSASQPLYASNEQVRIEDIFIRWNYKKGTGCYYDSTTVAGDVTAAPDSIQGMSTWTLIGDYGQPYMSNLSGQLSLTPAGVYEIG